jgi:PAS domain S-box-containing protein
MTISHLEEILGTDTARDFEAIFEAMFDGVWVCDSTPRLLWINSACEELNEIKREDVCGKTVDELLALGNFDNDVTRRVLSTGRPYAINQRVKSGRSLLVNGVPVFNHDGEVEFVVGTERDLTELNLLREELSRSNERSQRVNSELLSLKLRDIKDREIVVESDDMRRVLDTALRIAGFDTTVLLTGASGTGKSMIARVIHEGSGRREKPFMSVNCGAIPGSLLEAELFGYVEGAFTGANRGGKSGLIEAAHEGTLFLDEIDAFPPDAQVKMLTFLDTQGFIRVGGRVVDSVDVRLIAATNKNLAELVANGNFREDLWFRLNIVPIELPPLSARRVDIPPLVSNTLEALNNRYETSKQISPDTMDLLCRYDFPGNVRELQNALEHSFVMSKSDSIGVADLPPQIRRRSPVVDRVDSTTSLRKALDFVEFDYLERAIGRCRRQLDIGRELGVSQATVARLLKKHGLRIPRNSDSESSSNLRIIQN